ncbi:AAA family ATPase [Dyadobacter frigoris]|uniref:Endonuclease GajA/Old nuclease/RecF-like AAA domain-containing protein n=1 Tax=Dyadobacter frigoris TaxID=2576211 RepID=A0A4U6D3I6_9BACT|nr:AAA family ATPase [Dyadobacter frigoris]TKT91879.1 hypothetical protein FDK13_12060 [Dyadobacter frigoris]GLU53254.1 hypothetical protein Dfri01_27150 [Dyadobacter frigoris]
MQRIEVKNFGPLKDINLEIKDYMVFIGPQASGKSTLAKLIYFFWKVESDIYRKEIIPNYILSKISDSSFNESNSINKFTSQIRELFFELFPTHRNGQIRFIYSNGAKIQIDVARWSEKLNEDIIIDNSFFSDLNEFDERVRILKDNKFLFEGGTEDTQKPSKRQLDYLAQILLDNMLDNTPGEANPEIIFIPAGRSILSLLSNAFTFIDSNNLDYFNENFIRFTNKVRKFLTSPDHDNLFGRKFIMSSKREEEDIYSLSNELSFNVLKGDFHVGDNGDGIMQYHNNSGYVIPLKHTSSGQQEASWLINVIQYILAESYANGYDIIIEEPEAHLFPDAQRDITKLITLLSSPDLEKKTRLIVTTHSPYILATLNNSIKAFTTAQIENKSEEVAKILSKEFWINPENLFVGFMNKNEGEDNFGIQDIFDHESRLIDHEVLDQVSDDIIKQFDDLLDIQYSE